jgi:uncharacterized PurR-regulated membrane protein YhhQ (DUF165 family)
MTDVELFARFQTWPLWQRVVASNAISLLLDSILFVSIAFGPQVQIIASQYLVKLVMTVLSLPLLLLARSTVAPRIRQAVAIE